MSLKTLKIVENVWLVLAIEISTTETYFFEIILQIKFTFSVSNNCGTIYRNTDSYVFNHRYEPMLYCAKMDKNVVMRYLWTRPC